MPASKWSHYVKLSDLYYKNAESYARADEFSKATELLWGAIATATKAVAASQGRKLTAHRQGDSSLEAFVTALSKLQRNDQLLNDFLDAQAMHRNFYEGDMSRAYEKKYFSLARRLIAALYQNLPMPDLPSQT